MTATGSPRSPPTPPLAGATPRSPSSNCGIAAGPAARTGSGPPRTPAFQNLPLHGFDQNRIWCQLVQLACELMAWTQMLGYPEHTARRWEPKKLRFRLLTAAACLARHARRQLAHLAANGPWTELILAGRAAITGIPTQPG